MPLNLLPQVYFERFLDQSECLLSFPILFGVVSVSFREFYIWNVFTDIQRRLFLWGNLKLNLQAITKLS